MRLARFRKRVVRPLLVILPLTAAGFLGTRYETGNQGTVDPGRLYRSRQLSAAALKRTIKEHQIRTVINLRGRNPDQPWYQAELAATLETGAKQIDVPVASDQWLSRDQVKSVVDVLDSVQYPALVHCEWGAERTGLFSAIAVLLRPGSTLEQARAQFSAYYMFVDMKDGRVMYGHLRQYERWLTAARSAHSSSTFRRWLLESYAPEGNSRENWPCNPYPLEVVTRRTESGEIVVENHWPANRCPRAVAEQPAASPRR